MMESLDLFGKCKTLAEVQLRYALLFSYHHPKLGGAPGVLKEILKDYYVVPWIPFLSPSIPFNKKREILSQFHLCLNKIIDLGLSFKISGNQIILTGDAESHHAELKELGIDGPPYVLEVKETMTNAQFYENN